MDQMHRRRAKSRQAAEDTHAGQDQILDRWLVFQCTAIAVGGDGAADKAGIYPGQAFGGDQFLVRRTWREVLDQDIRARRQFMELGGLRCFTSRLIKIERHAFLAPVPNYETAVAK